MMVLWISVLLVAVGGRALPTAVRKASIIRSEVELAETYDYVILGGGTSGLTVAERLSEDPKKTVLVVESGDFDTREPSVLVPGLVVGNEELQPKYRYVMTSTPQPGINNRTYGVYAGNVVGGGSTINGMIFDRGTAGDYDMWEELGNPGWGWNDLLPYFRKSETFHPQRLDLDDIPEFPFDYNAQAHGFHGGVHSSMPGFIYPGSVTHMQSWRQMGIKYNTDGTDGNALGLFWFQASIDPSHYTRSYARPAYFNPADRRPNFHILVNTTVTKITMKAKVATGITFREKSATGSRNVTARKEVILAAGSVHTPQVLQLSGIGPAPLLKKLGIKNIVDLPGVGANFQDHPALYFDGTFLNDFSVNPGNLTTNETYAAEAMELYYTKARGPYTIGIGVGGAFLTLGQILNDTDTGSFLQNYSAPESYKHLYPEISAGYQVQYSLLAKYHKAGRIGIDESAFLASASQAVALLKPFSRGSIVINSTDPLAPPVVDYNVFSHPLDLEMFIRMLRVNRRLFTMPALAELRPELTIPDPDANTDAELREVARANAVPSYAHPSCTCPMMPRRLGGVVNSALQVYGVRNLSIVDASIFPIIPGTHLSSTVYAVAEKAADIIKSR